MKGRRKRVKSSDAFIGAFMLLLCLLFLYPIYMTLMLSVSESRMLAGRNAWIWPVGFSLDSYITLLSNPSIWRYYLNTLYYAVTGTVLTLAVTSLMAYPLTFRDFWGKQLVTVLLLITMFFGGGMIPTYMVMRNYRILNTLWVMILPGAVSAWNVIIFKTFFLSIPESLRESAHIDGAGHFRVLGAIILPLSKPLLATITLFTLVGYWNSYFTALIYLNSSDKMPIQIFLRSILVSMDYKQGRDMSKLLNAMQANPRTTKAAATIITIAPILCAYPFLQKHFAKGILVGSVKA